MRRAISNLIYLSGLLAVLARPDYVSAAPATAGKTLAVLTKGPKGSAAAKSLCVLFKPKELEAYAGEPLGPGTDVALGTGCQWAAIRSDGFVQVQIVSSTMHEIPSFAPGYKPLPNVGRKGFSVPEHEGWGAGAIQGADSAHVSIAGTRATEAKAIALLKELLKRRHG